MKERQYNDKELFLNSRNASTSWNRQCVDGLMLKISATNNWRTTSQNIFRARFKVSRGWRDINLKVLDCFHPSSASTQLMRVELILQNVQHSGNLFLSSSREYANRIHLHREKSTRTVKSRRLDHSWGAGGFHGYGQTLQENFGTVRH